jgi:branched-chain amino acid transport system substrate-binding protein
LLVLLLVSGLSACSQAGNVTDSKALFIASIFPTSGAESEVGTAMQNAVDLAVQQNASLGKGYTLSATNVDEANGFMDQAVGTLATNSQTMGIVGPLDSSDALAMLPGIEASGLTTISPSATLPGLTQADQASSEGLDFATLHPASKPVAFFRLPETDNAAGKAAADLALSATQPGLAAHAVFVVDDGTASGKAEVAAFKRELVANQGTVAGQASMTLGPQGNAQSIVSAIVEAFPDIVFFGGSIDAGAQLRSTLSLSGAPQMVILTVGPISDDPTWSTAVGVTAAAAYTTALLPARDLSKLPNTKDFVTAYHTAFPGTSSLPQSALAYDAAMDEISAIKSLISSGKPVTRAGVLAAVTSAHYQGITGTIAFDKNGDNATAIGFSVYTCGTKGTWKYQASLSGNG